MWTSWNSDNANAGELKARIAGAPGLAIAPDAAQSNILCFSVEPLGITATAFAEACLAEGIRIRAIGQHQIRATTHLDVDRAGILEAAEVIQAQAERFHGERR